MGHGIPGAIGDLLPVAAALALSPFPIIALVILLGGPQGRKPGSAFTAGYVTGLATLTAVLGLAASGVESTSARLGAGFQLALGLALVWAAWRKWRTRPQPGEQATLPRWAASLGSATPVRAAWIGAALGAANPKSVAFAYAAAATVMGRGLHGWPAAVALAVFVLMASSSVLAALTLRLAGGETAAARLEEVKQFLLRNNTVILMVVLLLAGLKVFGKGLEQIGG